MVCDVEFAHGDQGRFGLFDAVIDKHSAFHRHCAADIEMSPQSKIPPRALGNQVLSGRPK